MPKPIPNLPDDLLSSDQSGTTCGDADRVLIVGPVEYRVFLTQSGTMANASGADFRDLTATLLARHRPDEVVAPLLAPSFDILDVAKRLESFGFRGRLKALTSPLPDAAAVAAEVRSYCPLIEFTLVTFPMLAGLGPLGR